MLRRLPRLAGELTVRRQRLVPAIAAGLIVSGCGWAYASEQLPVIVTYELQHRREIVWQIRRDPKAFWTRQVLTRIEAQRAAPPRPLAQTVTVDVVFTVSRDGHLVRSAIGQSSGLPDVDRLASGMVERAQPFPPMPEKLTDSEVTFVLPVRFR